MLFFRSSILLPDKGINYLGMMWSTQGCTLCYNIPTLQGWYLTGRLDACYLVHGGVSQDVAINYQYLPGTPTGRNHTNYNNQTNYSAEKFEVVQHTGVSRQVPILLEFMCVKIPPGRRNINKLSDLIIIIVQKKYPIILIFKKS